MSVNFRDFMIALANSEAVIINGNLSFAVVDFENNQVEFSWIEDCNGLADTISIILSDETTDVTVLNATASKFIVYQFGEECNIQLLY